MKLRTGIAASVLALATVGGMTVLTIGNSPVANAAGSTIRTISETETMVNANCYKTVKREVTYYTHSSTKGWVRKVAPEVQLTTTETCDK